MLSIKKEMTISEFLEAVNIPDVHGSIEDTKCPFCPIVIGPAPEHVAKIGRDNSSETLGSNLEGIDPKSNHLYEDSEHGQYSVEAHHLICGNEILGDEKEVEKYLITHFLERDYPEPEPYRTKTMGWNADLDEGEFIIGNYLKNSYDKPLNLSFGNMKKEVMATLNYITILFP